MYRKRNKGENTYICHFFYSNCSVLYLFSLSTRKYKYRKVTSLNTLEIWGQTSTGFFFNKVCLDTYPQQVKGNHKSLRSFLGSEKKALKLLRTSMC